MRDQESLPPGWTAAPLRDVAAINPPNPAWVPADDASVSFVPMAAVEALSGRMDASTARPWSDVKKGFTRFQDGDVVFAKITPSMENGKVALAAGLANGIAAGTTEFHVFRPQPGVAGRYLLHYLLQETFRRRARARMTGTAGQLRVPTQFLEEENLPLAPTPEQDRIVEAIDSYLTRLDDAVASLERAQAKLKAYRASVLKAAVEGRLVPTEASLARAEKRAYEPAEELLARILKERRRHWEEAELAKLKAAGKKPKDDKWKAKYRDPAAPDTGTLATLPEGWCWATAAQITLRITDGEHVTPPRTEAGVLLLSARNVGNGKLILDEVDFISSGTHRDLCRRLTIEPGDVLLSCSGTVGRTCVVPTGLAFSLVRSVAVLKPSISSDYLSYALESPVLQAQVHRRKKQTAQANIFQGEIAQLAFPLPPLAEQDRIVAEISRLRSVSDASEKEIAANRARVLRLRQSVLKWAFEGKLVDQDPLDEPAEKVLARIQAERAAAASVKKNGGRRARGAA